jgi:hypothetical protein
VQWGPPSAPHLFGNGMTPRGARILIEDVIRKLMSASGDSGQEQADPVQVQSQDDLRAKIQSGEIPLGGKYEVNGVVFTRTR